jgi:hypothetical protein
MSTLQVVRKLLEHPMLSEMNQFGFLKMQGLENVVNQSECAGIDYYGNEIIEGDDIVIDKENFHEIILKENLTQYLVDKCEFAFFEVRGMSVVLDQQRLKVFAGQDLEKVLQEEYSFEFTTAE